MGPFTCLYISFVSTFLDRPSDYRYLFFDIPWIFQLLSLKLSGWEGIDVNSRFEISPAMKDIQALEKLFNKVRNLAQA